MRLRSPTLGRRPSERVHTSSMKCMRTPLSLHITKCFSEDGTLDAYSEIVFFNCRQHEKIHNHCFQKCTYFSAVVLK